MTGRIVYMDNNATTQPAPEVIREMTEVQAQVYGNASSMHTFGRKAASLVKKSRDAVASLLDCEAEEIVFTSGASESNNTVFMIARKLIEEKKGLRIITTTIEHPSIMQTAKYLKSCSVDVDFVSVDSEGRVKLDELKKKMGPDVVLLSVMAGNNETGTIQEIAEISAIAHSYGALFHTDATQAIGKMEISCRKMNIDYLSCSAHKFYGPKGVGALYVRKDAPYFPFIHGGEQENGKRAGTYNTVSIYGMGCAAESAHRNLQEEKERLWTLRERLRRGILERVPDVVVNGCQEHCLPGTLNVSFPRAEGESILLLLDMHGIAVSTGSACATGSLEPSYVLLACGLDVELAHGSIRFSLGRFNVQEDVDYVLEILPPVIKRLRDLSTR